MPQTAMFYINERVKNVFVLHRNSVRKAKMRPKAVRSLKNTKYRVGRIVQAHVINGHTEMISKYYIFIECFFFQI